MHAARAIGLWAGPSAPAAAAARRLATPLLARAAAPRCARRFSVAVLAASYQRPLTNQERKSKRAEAQRLGRNICLVNLGQKGMTDSFLEGFRLALGNNGIVKVRVGSCEETPDEVGLALTAAFDCVLVHKIGFALTFYREPGLPELSAVNTAKLARRLQKARAAAAAAPAAPAAAVTASAAAVASAAAAARGSEEVSEVSGEGGSEGSEGSSEGSSEGTDISASWDEGDEVAADLEGVQEIDAELATYLYENEDAFSDSDSEEEEEVAEEEEEEGDGLGRPNSGKRQAATARLAKANRPPPPPEFRVIG